MNLVQLYKILDTINLAGIKEMVISKTTNGVVVRGRDKEVTVATVAEVPGFIIENNLGVHRVQALLDRLKLFDLEQAKVSVDDEGEFIKQMTVKEGRKRASVRFSNPDKIEAPTKAAFGKIVSRVEFDVLDSDQINSAVSAFSPDLITLKGEGDDITIHIGEADTGDSFSDVVGSNTNGDWEHSWNVRSFVRLLKQAVKTEERTTVGISEAGVLVITVNNIEFILLPQTK